MKEHLTLPDRAGVIHLLPVVDLLVLLLVFFVLLTSVAQQAGIAIDPPGTIFRLRGYEKRIAITAKGGVRPSIFVGVKRVALKDLEAELEARREATGADLVVINADRGLPHGVVWQIQETALRLHFEVALGGRDVDAPAADQAESDPAREAPAGRAGGPEQKAGEGGPDSIEGGPEAGGGEPEAGDGPDS